MRSQRVGTAEWLTNNLCLDQQLHAMLLFLWKVEMESTLLHWILFHYLVLRFGASSQFPWACVSTCKIVMLAFHPGIFRRYTKKLLAQLDPLCSPLDPLFSLFWSWLANLLYRLENRDSCWLPLTWNLFSGFFLLVKALVTYADLSESLEFIRRWEQIFFTS